MERWVRALRPSASFRDTVVKAGFPADKFKQHPDVRGSRKGPQLPVFQPNPGPPKAPPPTPDSGGGQRVPSAKLPAGERPTLGGKPTAAALAANVVFTLVLGYLDSKIRNYFKGQQIERAWKELEWDITRAIDARDAEFQVLLKQTDDLKVIYANIHVDYVERTDIIDADTRPEVYFHKLELKGVGLSTQNLSDREGLYFEHFAADKYTHSLLVYSVPLYDPEMQMWRDVAEDQERHPAGHFGPRPQPRPDDFDQLEFNRAKGGWVRMRRAHRPPQHELALCPRGPRCTATSAGTRRAGSAASAVDGAPAAGHGCERAEVDVDRDERLGPLGEEFAERGGVV